MLPFLTLAEIPLPPVDTLPRAWLSWAVLAAVVMFGMAMTALLALILSRANSVVGEMRKMSEEIGDIQLKMEGTREWRLHVEEEFKGVKEKFRDTDSDIDDLKRAGALHPFGRGGGRS